METAIISGKGGTGKSCVAAAFASLVSPVVLADCDVETANLFLLFDPLPEETQVFSGGRSAHIDRSLCTNCGLCMEYCRFDAIQLSDAQVSIQEVSCEGCGLCSRVCPRQAIAMVNNDRSRLYSGSFRHGQMVYARLAPGEDNSGKLVGLVREKASSIALAKQVEDILIDGPPGIGCPVMSAITGVDRVVIVTEPSMSGLLDLQRVLEVVNGFGPRTWVILNKYDLHPAMARKIESFCRKSGTALAGKLPFDPLVPEAMVHCKSIIEWAPHSRFARELKKIWNTITNQTDNNLWKHKTRVSTPD